MLRLVETRKCLLTAAAYSAAKLVLVGGTLSVVTLGCEEKPTSEALGDISAYKFGGLIQGDHGATRVSLIADGGIRVVEQLGRDGGVQLLRRETGHDTSEQQDRNLDGRWDVQLSSRLVGDREVHVELEDLNFDGAWDKRTTTVLTPETVKRTRETLALDGGILGASVEEGPRAIP